MDKRKREIGFDEKLSIGQSLFYGVQSVIALNLFLGAIIIAGILQLNVTQTAILITLSFLASGIATMIQAGIFMKYPTIQSVAFASMGALAAVAYAHDLATAFGSLILGAVILILLGYFKLFSKIMKIIPPLVAGVVIMIIGINVMFVASTNLIAAPGEPGKKYLLAAIVFVLIFAFKTIGESNLRIASICGRGGVLIAIVVTTIIAALMHETDFSAVNDVSWVALPPLFAFGAPKVDWASSLMFVFIYIIAMVETVGNWFAISYTAKAPIDNNAIDRGIIGEGIGGLLGAFIGSAPVTSYATNCGVISITKVYSRWAAVGAGVIILVFSFLPKLMYLIASIPSTILWGTLCALCISILMSGLRSIHQFPLNDRNFLIVGIPIFVTLICSLLPQDLIMSMPMLLSYLFSSSICIGSIVVIILNLILPKEKETDLEETAPAEQAEQA